MAGKPADPAAADAGRKAFARVAHEHRVQHPAAVLHGLHQPPGRSVQQRSRGIEPRPCSGCPVVLVIAAHRAQRARCDRRLRGRARRRSTSRRTRTRSSLASFWPPRSTCGSRSRSVRRVASLLGAAAAPGPPRAGSTDDEERAPLRGRPLRLVVGSLRCGAIRRATAGPSGPAMQMIRARPERGREAERRHRKRSDRKGAGQHRGHAGGGALPLVVAAAADHVGRGVVTGDESEKRHHLGQCRTPERRSASPLRRQRPKPRRRGRASSGTSAYRGGAPKRGTPTTTTAPRVRSRRANRSTTMCRLSQRRTS